MTAALLQVALSVWPFDPPLDKGVEHGIVWATVKAPYMGVNGYVLIPAEGHPWSKGFPRGEDMTVDYERSRKNLQLLYEIQKRNGETPFGELMEHLDYEKPADYSLDDFLEVHGGVTYYQHPWIGFDTAHAFDAWDGEYDRTGAARNPHKWDRLWTPALVSEEAKGLARQVAEIARLEENIIDVEVVE
jgi:hypothetical protein